MTLVSAIFIEPPADGDASCRQKGRSYRANVLHLLVARRVSS